MIASILIIAVSLVLFLYWFRYTCVLILSTRTTRDYGAEVARANQLSFVGIQNALQEPEAEDLDSLRRSLDRDYRLVTSLMKQASGLEVGGDALEEIMLRMDFRVMKICYGISSRFSPANSRAALAEMTQIVAHFANAFGERAASSVRA